MFINLIEFPPVRAGEDQEFCDWFDWSNSIYERFPGFVSRRLLGARDEPGHYLGIVEHQSETTFMKMHASPERDDIWARVEPLLVGQPKPRFLDILITSEPVEF